MRINLNFVRSGEEKYMKKSHGINTKAIAEQLKQMLDANPDRFKNVKLFYDHGDSSKQEVCQPTTYMGRRYGADATLSAVDIVVTKGSDVITAVEIEESTIRPKTIIGEIFGIVLARNMRILDKFYSIKNATIIIAIKGTGKGKQSSKYVRLERHLNNFFKLNPLESVKRVRIITSLAEDLVRRVERLIRLEVGKQSRE